MDAVSEANERFTEKLTKIAPRRGLTKAQLASACGVSPQAMQRYFEGSAPRPHTALNLADALGVDPVYLFDEDEPYRDDFPESPAQSISDELLMLEAARRYAATERQVVELIERVQELPWDEFAKEIAERDGEPTPKITAAIEVARSLFHLVRSTVKQFDSVSIADEREKLTRGYGRWLPEAKNDRAAALHERIDAIYSRLTSTDASRNLFLSSLQGAVWVTDDPEMAIALVRETLERYRSLAG